MRNPFPGMNPYLEDPTLWGGVHHLLMSALHQQLNQRLPEGYVALVEERIYLETSDAFQHYVPDVLVARRREATSDTPAPTAVADPPVRIELHDPMTEPFLQIFSVRNKQRLLVAVIEVLSPANKTPNAEGRRRYLQKQRDLLHSTVHLLEIDLLHYGEHTIFLPREALLRERAEWDYLIALHRAGEGIHTGEVWFVRLIERLPRVSVPLLPADPEVVIDLQAAIDSVYEQGRYHELLDYSVEPPIPLTDEQRNWVRQHLQAQGIL
jgi:hypothetical protein